MHFKIFFSFSVCSTCFSFTIYTHNINNTLFLNRVAAETDRLVGNTMFSHDNGLHLSEVQYYR